jgi:hypothetical protein
LYDISVECFNSSSEYKDSIEKEFEKLLKILPRYRKEFRKEKAVWEKYYDAAYDVSLCADCGASRGIYVADVLAQATQILDVPLQYLYLHTQGKKMPYSKTKFTTKMIADAYSAYIDVVGKDSWIENKSKYQEALRKEQRCWNDLLECRRRISRLLSGSTKRVYDIGTNQMIRTKLYQLKNQNENLGMTNDYIRECALPKDCSDKELLEYPGFNKVVH